MVVSKTRIYFLYKNLLSTVSLLIFRSFSNITLYGGIHKHAFATMSDNNNSTAPNGLKNSNNSETLYNVIQNKRQTSRGYGTNSVSSNKHFSLNLDNTKNNTSVFNLNRTGSPCLPNFGSLDKDSMFNSKYQYNDHSRSEEQRLNSSH